MPNRQRKLRIELAGRDPRRSVRDGARLGAVEQGELVVHLGRRTLDLGDGMDHCQRHALLADGEVAPAAFGLRAPQRVGRHVDRTEAVGLASCGGTHGVSHGTAHDDRGGLSMAAGALRADLRQMPPEDRA